MIHQAKVSIRWGWAAAVVLGLLALTGCKEKAADTRPPPTVIVDKPVKQMVSKYKDVTGNTAASNTVNLVARVEGYLDKISFDDGAAVKRGDLLFTIQQDQYKAQLQQAQAQVAAQQAALVHAKTELGRFTALLKQDAASQVNVDHWAFQLATAQAGLSSAQAQVILAQLNLSYTEVRAPFNGRMGRHLVDVGNLVGAMGQQTTLAEIDQIDPLYVYFTINERDLLELQGAYGGTVSVNSKSIPAFYALLNETDYTHEGVIDFASLSVSPTTGTLTIRGIFPNPKQNVLPGLFVRVRVPALRPTEALLISGEAIAFDQQGPYVLVVNAQNVVERRGVKTGQQIGDKIVVEDGLQPSDSVIVAGLLQASPGRTVKPEPKPAAAPAKSGG